ncbi:MAG TPA: helix-turn-helix domain-containing protein [Rubrobacter sp.]|nr:helix-turn-helix domain-containing protein [Rubrobacter sp.]
MEVERLVRALSLSEDLAPFRTLVEPLVEHYRRRGSDLVKTLGTYFASGANASEAADRVFLRRDSMAYRLERVRKPTGLDLREPGAALAM